MNQPFYPFTILNEAHRFDFVSVGKEIIQKTVVFDQIDQTLLYNLMLADITDTGEEDVLVVSNNGDMKKVLTTVFQCIDVFLKLNPDAIVVFYGSTPERTDVYQWAITRELANTSARFNIQGYNGTDFENFNPKIKYFAFAISLKNQ